MISQFLEILKSWSELDTWIVITAALASMSCAIPGVFLLVRRQSMLGDALSHTALPGIALGFLAAVWLRDSQWITNETYLASRHWVVVAGAAVVGIFASMLTEMIHKLGRVEASAALGVVFTSLFGIGLLLVRMFADKVDLDPDCVLYGTIETSVMDRLEFWSIPRAALINGVILILNVVLAALFFKELRIAAFDPALATTMGINAHVIHYALTAITAATLVAAFESVGSILVIAMFVAPAATAHLLTDRLWKMVLLAVVVAALSAGLGHVLAITLPALFFQKLGFANVIAASTAGMMAVATGCLFVGALLFGPRYGFISRSIQRAQLALRVAAEDILGLLYRNEEQGSRSFSAAHVAKFTFLKRLAFRRLMWSGELAGGAAGVVLTDVGRRHAERLVRSHRLWESYMAKHLELPQDHLHDTAERVEHFLDERMRAEIDADLSTPGEDPHGRSIPSE